MERLTDKIRNFDGTASSYKSLVIKEGMQKGMPSAYCSAIVTKLADYEDAEEQGLLLRLPVEIGNIVYRINEYADEPIIPMGVTSIEIKGVTDTFKEMKCKECVFGGEFTYRFTDIGKTVFLTKEEAEQALKQMGEEL